MGPGFLPHIVSARHVAGHLVHLRFEDGVEGDVDLRDVIGSFSGVLAPLADPKFVAKVFVNERRTITWPGELDLDPIVLHCAVQGVPVPTYENRPPRRAKAVSRGRRRTTSGPTNRGGKAGA